MTAFISKENERSKRRVEALVSDWYDTTPEELNSHSKSQSIVIARYICFFLLKRDFELNPNRIAIMYKRDHTTILNGLKRVKELELWKDVREVELSTYPHL